MTNLSLTYSFWWIIICLVIGAGYAWIQYTKKSPWSKQLNYGLASVRLILVAFISFFLLEPYFQSITNYFQKPLMVIAIDNSESMKINLPTNKLSELRSKIGEIENALTDKGFEVKLLDLNGNAIEKIDSLKFDNSSTDLSTQLNKVKSEFSSFNLSGIVLFSDGIFNEGYSPLAVSARYPIYTVGVGDTSKIRDIAIKEIRHNSTVFEGNTLLLEVQVVSTDNVNENTEITVHQKGKIVATHKNKLSSFHTLVKTVISIPISESGKQSLTINLKPIEDEFTILNNKQTIYFDVIDAKKRILLVAAAPHPDLKAIKSTIEKSEYYEVDLVYDLPSELDYDLIILHQYPTVKTSPASKEILNASNAPKWLIVGMANDFRYLKNSFNFLTSYRSTSKIDLVKPLLNPDFEKFQLNEPFLEWLSDLPPVAVRYGLVINNQLTDVFIHQQIGSVVTNQPLLFFTKFKEHRLGVFLGTNIWKWKLDEFRVNQTHINFDDLISKTVQYLSSNANRKRFYAIPQKDFYEMGEDVLFNTEEYNALFERIIGKKVILNLTNENGDKRNYSYLPLSENSAYKISGLDKGVYSYVASTEIDSKKYFSRGQFIVKQLNKEALNPVADFDLLRKVAFKSQASFYDLNQMAEFKSQIDTLNPISTIHTTEKDEPLINIKWLLIILMLLATTEWFLRKFYGGY